MSPRTFSAWVFCGSACKTCKQACSAPAKSPASFRRLAVSIASDIKVMDYSHAPTNEYSWSGDADAVKARLWARPCQLVHTSQRHHHFVAAFARTRGAAHPRSSERGYKSSH